MKTLKLAPKQLSDGQLKDIKAISGVTNVQYADNLLTVELEDSGDISQILNQLSDIEASLSYVESDYPVENMSCGGCAASATRLLSNQAGVVNAIVEYSTQSAKIYYDAAKTNPEKLKAALSQLGYTMVL
jgi:copper chaperone CopZ